MRNRYVEIEDRTEDLRDLLGSHRAIGSNFLPKYELTWLHHENALEGVVYTVNELAAAVSGVTVAEASVMNGYRDIRNHKAALDLVRAEAAGRKPKVNLALVKKLYETLGQDFEDRTVAELRREMPLHRAYFHEIAQPAKIPGLLDRLFERVESSDFRNLHPIQRSSTFQHEFMRIYPFTEGSGRIARLVGNLFLLHGGLDICVVPAVDRQRYYESFRTGEPALRELLLDAIENALTNAEKYVRQALLERRRAAR
jgi:Fic family protein